MFSACLAVEYVALADTIGIRRTMMSLWMNRATAILHDERGSALAMAMIFTVALTISGLAFLKMGEDEVISVKRQMDKIQALHLAEGGIRRALWRMERLPESEWTTWATFSDTNGTGAVETVYDSTSMVLTSTATIGKVVRTVMIEVEVDRPTDHIVAYTSGLIVHGSSGTFSSPDTVQFDALPTVDLDYYRNLASYVYGRPDSLVTKKFDTTLGDGIHFVYGDADIKTGTQLNGTIVATGTIRFYGETTINAQQVPLESPYYPAYYPAVIGASAAESSVEGGSPNLVINGMLYSAGSVDLNPVEINGPIVAPLVELSGSFDLTYDERYSLKPPGFQWPVGSFSVNIGSWAEE